jgi:dTDP-glucose pyrophosphorylase
MSDLPLSGIDAAILVGGMGTRLRSVVSDLPKPMAPVGGRPFLFYLLDHLALRGAQSVTLCCGYKADAVQQKVGVAWMGMPVHYSLEKELLGTGGALRLARPTLVSERVLVMNGDSCLMPDFVAFRKVAEGADACLALVEVPDAGRFGAVSLSADGGISAFCEKSPAVGAGWINGGVYLLSQSVLDAIPEGVVSLEREIFPKLVQEGRVFGHQTCSPFLDIGVPESYHAAEEFFAKLGLRPSQMFPDAPAMREALVKMGVCVIICNEAGQILMEQRSDCGWWGLPGGKMDPGETVAGCAVRESREETGLDIEISSFLGLYSDPVRRTVLYPDNHDLRHLVDAAVVARVVGGHTAKSHESLDLQWYSAQDIPVCTVPPVVEILRDFFAKPSQSDGLLR